MKVQLRYAEARRVGGGAVYTKGGGSITITRGVTLTAGQVAEMNEEQARRYAHKLCTPGSQVLGEPVKPEAEIALVFGDAKPKKKAGTKKATAAKPAAEGDEDA